MRKFDYSFLNNGLPLLSGILTCPMQKPIKPKKATTAKAIVV